MLCAVGNRRPKHLSHESKTECAAVKANPPDESSLCLPGSLISTLVKQELCHCTSSKHTARKKSKVQPLHFPPLRAQTQSKFQIQPAALERHCKFILAKDSRRHNEQWVQITLQRKKTYMRNANIPEHAW